MKKLLFACSLLVSTLAFGQAYKVDVISTTNASWSGQPIKYPFEDGKAIITTATISLKQGEALAWHLHEVPMAVYVLEGELTIEDEHGARAVLQPGQTAVESVGIVHRGIATGNSDVKMFAIYMGTSMLKNTIAKPDHKH